MPSTSQAIVCTGAGQAEVQNLPTPQVRDGHILVKTKAVALNPTDWKSVDSGEPVGNRIGCDFSGVVEEVGQNVAKPFKKGDRVCGMVFGAGGPESAAFSEYLIAKADLAIKVPENLTFEEAATLGVGIVTVGQSLYQSLKLPFPDSPLTSPVPILIYGGSTATGILGIQFAKLSGLTVITTSSPRNFDYLKSLGADAVYDYHEDIESLARKIKESTNNKLTLAWDCSPTEESARLCAMTMSDSEKAKYSSLLPIDKKILTEYNSLVESEVTLGYSVFGEAFTRRGRTFEAKPEDREFAGRFWELSKDLLADGRIKVANMAVDQGGKGLEGVLKGLDDLKQGRVSGTKLVYTIESS
ncbi:hypothetical protein N0V93_008383 [Gnomoniopsis smithogilvyi]|uniref:Enoyl reductase (ER) domain-containing protein n=1 Tax=Gnomoniopsis smithogilvyi TaxID=1191159 RepID=A0A9W9CTU6_9PEZI|nr:hypothetical protein N0V93_008383 [Gnomoniopsis smithogilvyi]